jgi:hypothetical protein
MSKTSNILIKTPDTVPWDYSSKNQSLSEDFIREHSDQIDWGDISFYQKLSEEFIREFSNQVDWVEISRHQKLSEEFIREFSDKVFWGCISYSQKLSEGFIREIFDKLTLCNIEIYQKLSPEFIKEFNFTIPDTCWLYKDKEYKRKYIKKNTLYQIIGNKVIAYKSCRYNGYSVFNFQYHYEVGGEYEANADYNIDNLNSFGLSAGTKEMALDYFNKGKLFKVEIDLEDIAAIIYKENKIRASKIKILEEIKF